MQDLVSLYMQARTYLQMRSIAADDNVNKLRRLEAVLSGEDALRLPLQFDKSAYRLTSKAHSR